jgi:DNA-binding NarL/FixJ family response regulator
MECPQQQIRRRGAAMLPDQPGGRPPTVRRPERADPSRGAIGVLIVEDDFLIGMQSELALTEAGFEVVGIATTAEEALELARQHRPSLAVMDIRLAGHRDGIDAAGELFRELGIRCVFATAHDDQRTRALAEPIAPLGWLTKPYTMASLVAAVQKATSPTD